MGRIHLDRLARHLGGMPGLLEAAQSVLLKAVQHLEAIPLPREVIT